jgi:PPP family 3-phenylpropionic acid transporter
LNFFSPYLIESAHWEVIGLMSALASTSEIPFMYYSRRIIDRLGALNALALGCAAAIVRLGILALFPFKAGIVASQFLHSLSYGLFHPAALAFISSCVPPERRALGMSLYLALGTALPSLLGNIMGGYIVEHFGYRSLFGTYAFFPLMSLALYLLIRLSRKNPAKTIAAA